MLVIQLMDALITIANLARFYSQSSLNRNRVLQFRTLPIPWRIAQLEDEENSNGL